MIKRQFLVLLLLASVSLSIAFETPTDLFTDEGLFVSQPYAPELYERNSLVENPSANLVARASAVLKERSSSDIVSSATNILKRDFVAREDKKVKRQSVTVEVKAKCTTNAQCGSGSYCGSKSNTCRVKKAIGKACKSDLSCSSGYCCESQGKCKARVSAGSKCHGNHRACDPGSYCSKLTDRCKSKQAKGGKCFNSHGCQSGLRCFNKTCGKPRPTKPHKSKSDPKHHKNHQHESDPDKKHHHHHHDKGEPHRPQPSGSRHHPRELQEI